jgi:AMP-binding enzyme
MTIYGERRRSFREAADRVARLARALLELGVRPGDRVAMLSFNSDRYSEYLLAVPWADAVLNPVNTRWSAAEIAYSLRDSDSRVLLADDTFGPMLPALREAFPGLATVIHAGDGPAPDGAMSYEDLIAGADPVEDVRRGGSDLAGVFYRGGTTGFPKGVMLSHANLGISWLGSAACGYLAGPDSRTLHTRAARHRTPRSASSIPATSVPWSASAAPISAITGCNGLRGVAHCVAGQHLPSLGHLDLSPVDLFGDVHSHRKGPEMPPFPDVDVPSVQPLPTVLALHSDGSSGQEEAVKQRAQPPEPSRAASMKTIPASLAPPVIPTQQDHRTSIKKAGRHESPEIPRPASPARG